MPLESLLLTRDAEVIRVLRRVLTDLEIALEVCTGSEQAQEHLHGKKFDAVIIDCDDVHGSMQVLKSLRQSASNKTSTVFAIVNGITSMPTAFAMGANLVLEKPISLERALHSFRAARGLAMVERRHYYRQPVAMEVTLSIGDKENRRELTASAHNLSEGGMAVYAKAGLAASGAVVGIRFRLPGTRLDFEATGRICWADPRGYAGLRFESMPHPAKERLQRWLARRAPEEKKATPGK